MSTVPHAYPGGCSWQWLQRTGQLPTTTDAANVSSHTACEARAAAICNQHVKQTKRLLRLFRHALAKRVAANSADSVLAKPASVTATLHPVTQSINSAAPASNSAQSASAADGHGSAPAQCDSTATRLDSAAEVDPAVEPDSAAEAAMAAGKSDSVLNEPRSAAGLVAFHQAASALKVSGRPPAELATGPQTVFLVETAVPWKLANLGSCQTPCVFNFSVSPDMLAGRQLVSLAENSASRLEEQRMLLESNITQAIRSVFKGHQGSEGLCCASSVKVRK